MSKDILWETFVSTGDPLCYLLYAEAGETAGKDGCEAPAV